MQRVAATARVLTVIGGLLVGAGWIIGGFPVPDGAGAAAFWGGIVLGALAESVVWLVGRRAGTAARHGAGVRG